MTRKREDEYREKMADGLKVVIDLQFYDLMSEKEQASLGKQMAYCHSTNRKSERPFHYIVTSFTGKPIVTQTRGESSWAPNTVSKIMG